MGVSTLLDVPRYRRFVGDRDKALEKIHLHTQTDISRLLHETLSQIEGEVAKLALSENGSNKFGLAQSLETYTYESFGQLLFILVARLKRMKRAAYTIASAGELEAIGQSTQKTTKNTGIEFRRKLNQVAESKTLTGESIKDRVWLSLMNLRDRILRAFRIALINEATPKEVLSRVKSVFPKIQVYKNPPRELKPFREANEKPKRPFNFNFIDDDDWNLAVQAYKNTELPESRFDNAASYDPEVGYARYNWEVEQDTTNEFVNTVRQGQVDAANELGIKEFVWIAILDDKTDKCCSTRIGMTTSEIEDALSSGKLDKNLCDATVPPAHFNCRCSIGPVASADPVEGPDWQSFNDWLNS